MDSIPSPPETNTNTNDCDLCMNTIFVAPDASELFDECDKSHTTNVSAKIFTHSDGYTTLRFAKDNEDTSPAKGNTGRGVMCTFVAVFVKNMCVFKKNENSQNFCYKKVQVLVGQGQGTEWERWS